MKVKAFKSILSSALALILLGSMAACGDKENNSSSGGSSSAIPVKMLVTGFVNLPTDANDPYKKWIKDNYNLDINLKTSGDLSGTAVTEFASNDKPDIVVFDSMDTYNMVKSQKVLLDDWTPYLSKMPNAQKIVEMKDADNPDGDSVAKQMLTQENKLGAIWTVPDAPTWSLKIREDWADEYRATTTGGEVGGLTYPAGSTATNGSEWQPLTPTDLIHFARWIKATKPGCYAFTSAGGKSSLGTLGNWLPLMWGTVAELPYGAYVKDNNEVGFPVIDGTHQYYIDYLKQIVSEGLIDPAWYEQTWENKTKTKQGFIGIEWYPGSISTETQAYHTDVDTTNWWKTYPVPKDASRPYGGFQPSDGFLGTIVTVSVKAANDDAKMEKIIKLLDDLAMTKSVNENGETVYNRSATYDALRWGIGIEDTLAFQTIENTNRVYLYTGDEGVEGRQYRSEYPGAWDWGMFFRSKDDGVVQGTSNQTVTKIVNKVIEHDATTANFTRRLQYGSVLKLDSSIISTLTKKMQAFEYRYVTTKNLSAAELQSRYDAFVADWKKSGGDALLVDAAKQFKNYGWIS